MLSFGISHSHSALVFLSSNILLYGMCRSWGSLLCTLNSVPLVGTKQRHLVLELNQLYVLLPVLEWKLAELVSSLWEICLCLLYPEMSCQHDVQSHFTITTSRSWHSQTPICNGNICYQIDPWIFLLTFACVLLSPFYCTCSLCLFPFSS